MALFLDFDGTLAPIVRHPDQATLNVTDRNVLRSLSRQIPVVIVSGRRLVDVRSRVNIQGLCYAGNHGLEISGKGLHYRIKNAVSWRRWVERMYMDLHKDLGKIPGIQVENKGYTLSIHYRRAREKGRKMAERLFQGRLHPFVEKGQVRISHGKAVWEVRPPVDWDKGRAVKWILSQPSFQGRWPLYFGDDKTDQDAFRAIRSIGMGVWVGPQRNKGSAHFTVTSPRDVHRFLRWLLTRISGDRLNMSVI